MYREKFELNGIIYLHRITDPRLGGSALKNLRMFRKLCGEQFYPRVVLATTMWENLTETSASPDAGVAREGQLSDRDDWWGMMQKKGSRVFRHMDTEDSALKIIDYLLSVEGHDSLAIQREIVEENKTLADTGAGQEVNKELKEANNRWEQERKELRDEFNQALAEKDDAMADVLKAEMDKLAGKVEQSKRDHETLLHTKFKQLAEENEMKYERRFKQVSDHHQAQEARQLAYYEKQRKKDQEEQRKRDEARDAQIADTERRHEKNLLNQMKRQEDQDRLRQQREDHQREQRDRDFAAERKSSEARFQSQLAAERESRRADQERLSNDRRHAEQSLQSLLSAEKKNRQADQEQWEERNSQLVASMGQQNRLQMQQLNSTIDDLRDQIAESRAASVASYSPPSSEEGSISPTRSWSPARSDHSGSSHISYHTHTHNNGCSLM